MSHIEEKKDTFKSVICNRCVHKISGLKCRAYDIIPDLIILGKNNHSIPLKGQNNDIVFKEKKAVK